MDKNIIEVKDLKTYFPVKKKSMFSSKQEYVKAVDGVSFSIKQGETFGVVGESGCGKSTMGKTILRLIDPTDGQIIFDGEDISKASNRHMKKIRRNMQMVFQDPYASLDPRMKVKDIIGEPLKVNKLLKGKELEDRVKELLGQVGLLPEYAERFPHEFSGGQRQRIGIARALALKPKLIVCDEPVSALDVSNQAQILNLLNDLKDELGFTYIFIAHGLAAVRYVSTKIGVMYLGKMVEIGDTEAICNHALHPYTQAILSAALDPDPDKEGHRIILNGDIPSPINPPKGCRFHTRCPYKKEICEEEIPLMKDYGMGHKAACHFAEKTMSK